MAFALYGELPAGRPTSEVRSHHATSGQGSMVELTFSVEGRTHRVRRTPEHERAKRRGTGTKVEPPTAELYAVEPDGTERPLASGPRNVKQACIDLVGLDAAQFERVVLLPQGKFQQFLLADTATRRPLLQQLFGTALFRRAVDELKRRASELRAQVARVETDIDHHRRNAKDHLRAVAAGLASEELDGAEPDDDLDLLDAFWQKLAPSVHEAQELGRALNEEATAAGTAASAGRVRAQAWDQREALRRRRQVLADAVAEIASQRTRIVAARRAGPVVAAAAALDEAGRSLTGAIEGAATSQAALASSLAGLGLAHDGDAVDPDEADRTVESARADAERMAVVVRRLDAARLTLAGRRTALTDIETRRCRVAEEQTRVEDELNELAARRAVLAPLAAEAASLVGRLQASADRLSSRRRLEQARAEVVRSRVAFDAAEARLAEVLAAFVAGAAPRLAAALQPGEPCAVCGSPQHPAPAAPDVDARVDVAALEAAQRTTAEASSARASAERVVSELSAALGEDATRSVAELEGAHEVLDAEERTAARAANDLLEVDRSLRRGSARRDELVARSVEVTGVLATATAAVEVAVVAVEHLEAELGDTDAEALGRRCADLRVAAESIARCRTAAAARVAAEGAHAQAAAGLTAALDPSGFDDVATARGAWVAGPELAGVERCVAEHDAGAQQVEGALAALADAGLPDARPDAGGLAAHAADLRGRADAVATRVERLLERAEQGQAALAAARDIDDASTGLREIRDRSERVASLCDGQGPLRIGLETWVLAGELDRVTAAANVHLARLTTDRYSLERTDDAGHRGRQAGLDLTVLDSHTGRVRAPATLSGGEQFQASLALALGLADVVSLGGVGSGRRFEALFVDEGFGSLDADALDQAVDALHQIRASGRMVGVITHVEAMKQQLPVGLAVRRRPDGHGSTLLAS